MTKQTKKFDAEVGKVLHLMIHSLYTNKDVAIRELISNASDACDKLKFLSQTDNNLMDGDADLKIDIRIDKEGRTISISDNGIGMNKEELEENLGTIARSGTQNFIEQLTGDAKKDNQLIGQFGVGFYSSFMIADQITVTSKKAGEEKAFLWFSDGKGEYSISEIDNNIKRGTEIKLHVKSEEETFLDQFKLKHIIKSYSDHIAVPIFFYDNDNKPSQLNSSSALWKRSKSEITEKQYEEFYKSVSYSADKPWMTFHNKNEGAVEYTNLLFIPSNKTFDLFHPDRKCRVKLYIKKVFIADEKIDLIPNYLRFLRGIIDSEDLPLNISRETLQHNHILEKIKRSVTSRIISELKKRKDNDFEEYLKFWHNFGMVLKEGMCEATSDHQKLLEVCVFRSALHKKLISLDEYISNAGPEQKNIYFLSGDDPDKLISSPQIEGFLSKKIDVLLFTDTVDDFWVNVNRDYKGFEIKSVTRSDISLDDADNIDYKDKEDKDSASGKTNEKNDKAADLVITFCKESLGDLVKDVKISKKLVESPACLAVGDGAMDIRMERFLVEQKQIQGKTAKILEINFNHPIIRKIATDLEKDIKSEENKNLVLMLHDQACVLEGEPVYDVSAFSKRMNDVIEKNINNNN